MFRRSFRVVYFPLGRGLSPSLRTGSCLFGWVSGGVGTSAPLPMAAMVISLHHIRKVILLVSKPMLVAAQAGGAPVEGKAGAGRGSRKGRQTRMAMYG